MLDAPTFFSNHFRESHPQSYFQWNSDTERSNVWRNSNTNQSILSAKSWNFAKRKFFPNVLFSGFTETKTNCTPQRFLIDTHLSRPIWQKQIRSTSVPGRFCSIRDKVNGHLRYSSILMCDALKYDCVTLVSILTLHFILVSVKCTCKGSQETVSKLPSKARGDFQIQLWGFHFPK